MNELRFVLVHYENCYILLYVSARGKVRLPPRTFGHGVGSKVQRRDVAVTPQLRATYPLSHKLADDHSAIYPLPHELPDDHTATYCPFH